MLGDVFIGVATGASLKAAKESARVTKLVEKIKKAKVPASIVTKVGESAKKWLGNDFVIKRSDAKGFVAVNKAGTRKLRLDFDGHGHPSHGHLEIWDAARKRWIDATPGQHRLPFK